MIVVRTSVVVVAVTFPVSSSVSETMRVCFQLPLANRPQTSISRGLAASSAAADTATSQAHSAAAGASHVVGRQYVIDPPRAIVGEMIAAPCYHTRAPRGLHAKRLRKWAVFPIFWSPDE